jgi:transcriptional regulator GlxA family with amidase domain
MATRLLRADEIQRAARETGFRVRQLAAEVGMDVRTLERSFDKTFGCAPLQWLNGERMSHAAALLRNGLCVKQVAAAVGFQQPQSFFRCFRRHFDCTPIEYMKRCYPGRVPPSFSLALSQTATALSRSATPPALRYEGP